MVIIANKRNYFKLLPILLVSFVLFKLIYNPGTYFTTILKVISPFIWAFSIAYLLNPIMVYLERKLKIKRIWSIFIVYIIFLGLLVLTFVIITPRIIVSIGNILKDIPDYIDKTERWISYQLKMLEAWDQFKLAEFIRENIDDTLNKLSTVINPILNATVIQAISITSGIFNVLLGVLISIYFLRDKDKFKRHSKKIIYAFFDKEKADKIIGYINEFNLLFSKYLVGKIFDSLIIGMLCFIGTSIIGAPYALVISVIVGITNLVPYFGPFIGMIPAVLITLFYSPITALWIFLFILGLQQFDGLYLGPKILGTQVGLSPVLVICSIIIGGGLFGILGMFLAVPIGAIIKLIVGRYVDAKLKNKDIVIK